MSLVPGDRIGERYRVIRPLGHGGMAHVFLVEEEPTGQSRTLKQLRLDESDLLDALRSEFSLLAEVTHPRLTRVYDFGSWRVRGELYHYYTAEWIDGPTLAEHALERSSPFMPPLVDAIEGLAALHDVGMRHGDFTPDNVLVGNGGRGVLIDLGCARSFGKGASTVAGTPTFMAPELTREGGGDARADLFSVGATIRWLHERVNAPLEGPLAKLTARLLAPEPHRRPTTAREVLDELGARPTAASSIRSLAPRLFGRDRERARFARFLAAVRARSAGPRVAQLVGPPGSGQSRLLRDLIWRAEVEQTVLWSQASERTPVRWLLATATGVRELGTGAREGLAAARALAERNEPLLLALEDADRIDPAESELLLSFARSLDTEGATALLLGGAIVLTGIAVETIELAPLDRGALRQWTSESLSEGAEKAILAASGGWPGSIERELEQMARARRGSRAETQRGPRVSKFDEIAARERPPFALLAALGGELDGETWSVTVDDWPEALAAKLVRRDRSTFRLPSRADLPALQQLLGPAAIADAHHRIAGTLASGAVAGMADDVRHAELARHCALSGDIASAEQALFAGEAWWRDNPRAAVGRLAPLLAVRLEPRAMLLIADLSLRAGEMQQALDAAARVLAARPALPLSSAARLVSADALLRLGRARRAERVLAPLLKGAVSPEIHARALERTARARFQLQDPAGAESAARAGLALETDPVTAAALREALGMAAGYLGRTDEAEACFSSALDELPESAPPRDRCRLLAQRAIVSFRAGRVASAIEDHARALAIAERHALDDLVCVSSLNLGTAEQQAGDLGSALRSYERGLSVARALGRESTELTLRYNLANLRAEIGDGAGADRDLAALERAASSPARERFAPPVALVRAELALARGEPGAAIGELDRAAAAFASRGLLREGVEVEILRAEAELLGRDHVAAEETADRAETRAAELCAEDLAIRAASVGARAALARGDSAGRKRLEAALERAVASGQRLLEAKVATDVYLAAVTLGESGTAENAERARRAWDRLAANLPEALREVFWGDPRRAGLERFTRVQPIPAAPGDSAEALRRLLSLSRRLNSSLALDRVLDYAVEAAVELTAAERGFLLLGEANGEMRVGAERQDAGRGDPPSRTIVERVLATDDAILTTDAQADERFRGRGSIHGLRLKSVLCVPVSTPGQRLGVLYVDSRLEKGRFQETDRRLLAALADHVAIAISNARLHAELDARARQIDEQRRALERLSRNKDRELARLRERVELQNRALGLRYDYSRIVGRSGKMREVLAQLDRLVDSHVGVLIQGESGTGKELVARALHTNGPRKAAPFAAVNCSAIPEALLESELFGYVRGAFTGADRDKKGLLVEAHGGTLFLDEIGELPLAMQAKLLRVLQEREVRPLGAARSTPFDVRLVCATLRDLASDVEAGRFRQDLFYRVAVVVIELPPLRERIEDLPELARTILDRLARETGRTRPELGSDALRLLSAHSFPGNVRELENLLTRAFVLGSGPRIGAADLGMLRPAPRRSTSATRTEFHAEERARIFEALRASRWNVSQVSRALGIPRNTLYRKLEHYGLSRQP